eukprot:TRINITY_DN66614_c0_g1_i1.p1 TRINITY_DN66614_c0_g1~~TRINITY_DN66614_c0_g1_i1.p1  ORF type:complete len:886 (-),score=177.45 TRINITY_DN66614_c0_g1_i1:745-3402(-)
MSAEHENAAEMEEEEDLDAPTPGVDEIPYFRIKIAGGSAMILNPEESLPWYVSACVKNEFDALKKSWGMKTRRDVLREERAHRRRIAALIAKEERMRRKATKLEVKEIRTEMLEWTKAKNQIIAKLKAEERRKAKEKERKKRAKAKKKRAERRAKQKALEKEKKAKAKRKADQERRRKQQIAAAAGDSTEDDTEDAQSSEDDPSEPEEESEEEMDDDLSIAGSAQDEEEDLLDDPNTAELDGEDDEDEEEEDDEDDPDKKKEGEEEGQEGEGGDPAAQQEGDEDEDGEMGGPNIGAIDVNFRLVIQKDNEESGVTIPDDEPKTDIKLLLRSAADVAAEAEREKPNEDDEYGERDRETPADDEEEEAADDKEEKEQEPPNEDVDIDLLTITVTQGAVECTALLLSKGARTEYVTEYLETVTTSEDSTLLHKFIDAAAISDKQYKKPIGMDFSWLFRTILPTMDLPKAQAFISTVLEAGIRPSCTVAPDSIATGREGFLFCNLLFKLEKECISVLKGRKKDGEEDDEEEEPPQQEEDDNEEEGTTRVKRPQIPVPAFIMQMLDANMEADQLQVQFALESPESADVVCAVVPQEDHPWQRLDLYWSDIALLLLAMKGTPTTGKFEELLKRKAALFHEFGKPAGTWEPLYKSCNVLTHEMLQCLIRNNPIVFTYAGGVQLFEFIETQWSQLTEEFQHTLVHQFYRDILRQRTELKKLEQGAALVSQAEKVGALYDAAITTIKTDLQNTAVENLQKQISENSLELFTPYFVHYAVEANNLTVVEYFLDQGCPDKVRIDDFHKAEDMLEHTITAHKLDMVKLLIGRGADLRAHWDGGRTTPLNYLHAHYSPNELDTLLTVWRESEHERNASDEYMYGILKKHVTKEKVAAG